MDGGLLSATATVEPIQIIGDLNRLSANLESLGVELANIDSDLGPISESYDEFVENHKAGLWERHLEDGKRMPAEDIRVALAHRAMSAELLGAYKRLTNRRARCEKAISRVKSQIEAKRSVLSALKEGIV